MLAITVSSFLIGEDDLQDVRSAVANLAARWKDLGLSLGIRFSDLAEINSQVPCDCLTEMLALWLRQSYNVKTIIFSFTKHTSLVSKLAKINIPF